MRLQPSTIVALTPIGRFPTVVHDPGAWWSELANEFRLARFSANAAWWEVVCSAGAGRLLRLHRPWRAAAAKRSGARAAAGLRALRCKETFDSLDDYTAGASAIGEHLALLNGAQSEFVVSLDSGPRVRGLDYDDSRSLVSYSGKDALLSVTIDRALSEAPREIDLLVVSVTSPEELLTAMITVRKLRERRPHLHACLADHGYENFSLSFHLARLRTAGTLDSVFDSIVESKDERDWIVPKLARSISTGKPLRGFLSGHTLSEQVETPVRRLTTYSPPPPVPTFAPEPVLSTRFSSRRCYWSRCAFCVQNNKYDGAETPSLGEIPAALERFQRLVASGYRTFVLGDEALSPAVLGRLSTGIIERGLNFSWCCRAKLELAFTRELFQHMRLAGCCEVLFGLESISPRVQKRMDKFVEGLTKERIKEILEAAGEAGIGVHVNLIAGFPGETPSEAAASVDFLIEALAPLSHATFTLNEFALFPETPVMRNSAFGIEPVTPDGDMPMRYNFRCAPELEANYREIMRQLPALRLELFRGLVWDRLGEGSGPEAVRWLYFGSGHGALFKQNRDSIFSDPLGYPTPGAGDADREPLSNAELRMVDLPMVHSVG